MPAFVGYFLGSLLLMLPDGFGDPIAGFANPHNQTGRDTPHLTVGHTPWSTSSRSASAFASRVHRAFTSATHGIWGGGREATVFISFLRASAPSACLATTTAPSSAWWSWWTWVRGSGGRAPHRGSPSSIFIDGGDCIGMRDVANASTSSTLVSIFIEQIQPSP